MPLDSVREEFAVRMQQELAKPEDDFHQDLNRIYLNKITTTLVIFKTPLQNNINDSDEDSVGEHNEPVKAASTITQNPLTLLLDTDTANVTNNPISEWQNITMSKLQPKIAAPTSAFDEELLEIKTFLAKYDLASTP